MIDSEPGAVRYTPVPITSVGGWWAVTTRIGRRLSADNAVLLAAGVAFFGIFAVFPTVVALVSVYGLIANPADVAEQVADLTEALPEPTRDFLLTQVEAVVATSSTELGVALAVAVVVALWSASSGVRHLMESIRAAYGESRQHFVRLRAQALLLAVAGVVFLAVLVAALTVVPTIVGRLSPGAASFSSYVRWPLIAVLMAASAGRPLPHRPHPGHSPPALVVPGRGARHPALAPVLRGTRRLRRSLRRHRGVLRFLRRGAGHHGLALALHAQRAGGRLPERRDRTAHSGRRRVEIRGRLPTMSCTGPRSRPASVGSAGKLGTSAGDPALDMRVRCWSARRASPC